MRRVACADICLWPATVRVAFSCLTLLDELDIYTISSRGFGYADVTFCNLISVLGIIIGYPYEYKTTSFPCFSHASGFFRAYGMRWPQNRANGLAAPNEDIYLCTCLPTPLKVSITGTSLVTTVVAVMAAVYSLYPPPPPLGLMPVVTPVSVGKLIFLRPPPRSCRRVFFGPQNLICSCATSHDESRIE